MYLFRERGREGEREGEKHPCERETSISCLSHTPNWGPGLQPRHVPWLGIEPVTFLFTAEPHQSGLICFLFVCLFWGFFEILFYFFLILIFYCYSISQGLFVLLYPLTSSHIPSHPLPYSYHQNLPVHNSVSVLLICLVCFLDSIVGRSVFIAILLFIVLIFFF